MGFAGRETRLVLTSERRKGRASDLGDTAIPFSGRDTACVLGGWLSVFVLVAFVRMWCWNTADDNCCEMDSSIISRATHLVSVCNSVVSDLCAELLELHEDVL